MNDSEGCLEKIVVFLLISALMILGSALCSGELNPVLEPASVQPGISIPEQGWLQWVLWVLRVPGMVIALAVVPLLWLRVLAGLLLRVSPSDLPIAQPPSDLPAAAVSVLETREATPRTLLTSILEMCQRGTLQITGVTGECNGREGSEGEGKYLYRLVRTDDPSWEWERTLLTVVPGGNVMVDDLGKRLEWKSSEVGDQLGELSRHRREAYHGFMSAEVWDVSGRSKRASGWAVSLDGGAGGGGDGDGGADL